MMNSRHLPAGQAMQADMSRRRPYNQNQLPHQHQHQLPHQHQHQLQQYPPAAPIYNGYMNPYNNANYYPQPLPLQYQNGGPPHQYAQYQSYGRSPPPMHQFAPLPQYQNPLPPRPQQSPVVVSTPYQAPPPPAPSSTQSSYTVPMPMTPPTPQTSLSIPPPSSPPQVPAALFRPPLPWLSRPELPWPARQTRRKKRSSSKLPTEPLELPITQQAGDSEIEDIVTEEQTIIRPETPSTNHPASEAESTNPTTPSSVQHPPTAAGETTPVAPKSRTTLPAVPIIPVLPKKISQDISKPVEQNSGEDFISQQIQTSDAEKENIKPANSGAETVATDDSVPSPSVKAPPKSWATLFKPAPGASIAASSDTGLGATIAPGIGKNAESLAEALRSFSAASADSKVAFLEPRGLVNTGNMCYMNSVLQVLVFCIPFYDFLDQVGKRAVHSFKSDTPLIDAMIMFMREYPIIDSAASVDQLRLRLKEGELEQYGEAFTPDFVYNVINKLPRFSSMRRGHQQDAEEFLGFLLEGLHDECVQVMRASGGSNTTSAMATPNNGPSSPVSERGSTAGSVTEDANGWLEVGPKQKAAVTRSSGTISTGSPVTKIFGGNLRSELRVPGLKDSVTLEPYQPLQLDIGSPHVNNIVDALKGLTGSEALHGDFKSPKGPNVTATKQVFIETVPPVLILHLKRFQYDNAGGTQKIWKKVGYPLDLEIPKEVFPRQKRSVYAHGGLPKYRLIAVVYHHGKNASGGHYTVDVRRQDGREWIRLDDTVIRRVRSEDVAEGGSEEDPKVLAAALEAHKKDMPTSSNIFSTIEDNDDVEGGEGWKQVNGSSSTGANGVGKKWSSVLNGSSTPKSKNERFSAKDNKVAYLLFYQKI